MLKIAAETGLEVVIRPPLVYGRGVKGNFSRVIRAVEKQFILPLGSINNKRSLVALDNLVDLIITCIDHPAAATKFFLPGMGRISPQPSCSELLQKQVGFHLARSRARFCSNVCCGAFR